MYWDPHREMFSFNIPFLNRPILWYGFFFALGFFIAYLTTLFLLRGYFKENPKEAAGLSNKMAAHTIVEKITLYIVLGTVIGARLGDVLFYQDLSEYLTHPLDIFKVWEGGLASHGGVMGVMVGIYLSARSLKKKFPTFSWVRILDFLAIPACFAGTCIRVGNFFNQEVLGKTTTLPWGIVFGHPVDGGPITPRHPAQLYEATFYLLLAAFLYLIWEKSSFIRKTGKLTGLFFILFFAFRFSIEFLKVEQSVYLEGEGSLLMGQLLSIPFILFGSYLLFRPER